MFTLKDSKLKSLLLHDEPIYLDNKIIGRTTSETIHSVKKNLSFGYISYENLQSFRQKHIHRS